MTPLNTHLDIGGIWRFGLFIGMSICLFLFIKKQRDTLPLPYVALWGYALFTALGVFEYPGLLFGDNQTAFDATSAAAFAEILLIPLGVLSLDPEIWIKIFKWICVAEILCVWLHVPGAFIAPSFDLAFIAAYLPFAPAWLGITSLITIGSHHGSTALLIIVVQCLAYKRLRRWVPLFIVVGLASAYLHQQHSLFDASERITSIYVPRMKWWAHSSWFFWLFGTGAGTFTWLSLMISKFENPHWIHMHSDWLQILFELGVVGFLLVLWCFFYTIKKVRYEPNLVAATIGIAAWMVTYHPFRFLPGAIFIGVIIRICNDSRRAYQSNTHYSW